MSTPCEIILYHKDKAKADAMAQEILVETKRLEKKYNYYDSESYLSQINNRSESYLDPESKSLLQRAKQYYKQTNAIFDITMATLKPLYGESQTLEVLATEREKRIAYVGCEHFGIKKEQLIFDNPFTQIDLGGFVKEYAVDRAIVLLRKKKFSSALVNFGGDIYALGSKPNGEVFRVGIKDPKQSEKNAQEIKITDQALTTSASYERSYTIENHAFSHILGKEERALDNRSVTVISSSCVESGVYSTALMIDATLKSNHKVIVL